MLLDTNMLINLGDLGSNARGIILECLIADEPLSVSAVTWAEYLCGPLKSGEEGRCLTFLSRIEPVDASTAALAAHLFNATGKREHSMGDCILAATAILSNEALATENAETFEPFVAHGLIIADS
jgi:predicted nucleic acid-binding protein